MSSSDKCTGAFKLKFFWKQDSIDFLYLSLMDPGILDEKELTMLQIEKRYTNW
jgi:hypothetical protein